MRTRVRLLSAVAALAVVAAGCSGCAHTMSQADVRVLLARPKPFSRQWVEMADIRNGIREGVPLGTKAGAGAPNIQYSFLADGRCGSGSGAFIGLTWRFVTPDKVVVSDPNFPQGLAGYSPFTLLIKDGELWQRTIGRSR